MRTRKLFLAAFLLMAGRAGAQVAAPAPVYPLPSPEHMEWQRLEQYAMICFGMSTFNDLEWGYGDTPLERFAPIGGEIDAEQWVEVCKKSGMKGLLIVAKHHDGFCLWPSKYTDYSVKNTSWRQGKGDLLDDIHKACQKHGMKFALYLSPWDRHHAQYGKKEYVEYFHKQIRELMERYPDTFEYWFDGANGGDGYYGGARENRTISNLEEYYNYPNAVRTIKGIAPKAMIFGGTCGDIRWIGNEEGWADETNWAMMPGLDDPNAASVSPTTGCETGSMWMPGEVDVSVRPGWYYHAAEDNKVKSVAQLVDIYYQSVGRNANLLLSFCPDRHGRIHPIDSVRTIEWWKTIQRELKDNILVHAKVTADQVRGQGFEASRVSDGRSDTYWATPDGVSAGVLTFTFDTPQKVNRLLLQEYIELGQRVASFKVEYQTSDGTFVPLPLTEKTTTIGYKRILRFNTVETRALRVNFERAKGPLCIANVEAFLAPNLMVEPAIRRDADDRIVLTANDRESEIYYTTNGSVPQVGKNRYTKPFVFNKRGEIKAIAYDKNFKKQSEVATQKFDLPMRRFRLLGTDSRNLFDGDPHTADWFTTGSATIDMGEKHTLTGITYLPEQNRWTSGYIHRYEVWAGETEASQKKVAEGEFSNIKNSPTLREVRFAPVKARFITLKAIQIVDDVKRFNIGEFSVISK